MKLYYSPGACSLASHIALEEVGLAYEAVRVDLKSKKTADGRDYLAVNEKGYVPTLALDSGGVLTENAAVLTYIADQDPGGRLSPAHGSFARYRFAEWLNFIATELHKGFGPLWHAQNPEPVKDIARTTLAKRFDYVDKRLAETPYLLGEDFSAADAYLFTIANWSHILNFDLAPWPALTQFMARVAARPAVQRAMKAEGLAT